MYEREREGGRERDGRVIQTWGLCRRAWERHYSVTAPEEPNKAGGTSVHSRGRGDSSLRGT